MLAISLYGSGAGPLWTRFRRWCADYDVHRHTYGAHRFSHPIVGEVTLNYETLLHTADPEQSLGLHTAEPGSPSERAVRLLASYAASPSPA
jgi:hypothetical protein